MTFAKNYLYESVTEYDINEPKRYDMKFGAAKQLILSGYSGEKICVGLMSDTLSTIQSDFKVKIDDTRNRIDIDVTRQNGVTEATAKEAVSIFVRIPAQYIGKVELAVNAETIEVHSLDCDSIELNSKTQNVVLEDVVGKVEIDCNLNMNVVCRSIKGVIAMNQVSATSRISIPEDAVFTAVTKGMGTSISFEKNGKPTEAFDSPGADNIIELNGMKSELVICTLEEGVK
ncbi:MAG: transcriptional regulator [Lachnospiraceae bacterium]|nr:transcriptional regulator [Lachnospiraceae bacterium]